MGSQLMVKAKTNQIGNRLYKVKYLSIDNKNKLVNILTFSAKEAIEVISGFKDFQKLLGVN